MNSSDSIDSNASLTHARGALGKTLAAVNASIKKDVLRDAGSKTCRMSDPSLEKLKDVNAANQTSSSQPPGNRLIKVNRSKKKLDTARRSRI